ncbi:MAG: ABC transporter permease [Acidobacteriota bacterium]
MLRGLKHFWRSQLAVVAGTAVATAVLTGALVVGDSMRQSLRQLTEDRLGAIEQALIVPTQLRREVAQELETAIADETAEVVPAVVLRGTAEDPESQRRASRVGIYGIDENFGDLFADSAALLAGIARQSGQIFAPAVLNRALADELGVAVGEALLLSFEGRQEIPQETLVGGADSDETLEAVRVTVAAILPNRGPGRFGLTPSQELPRSAFVPLRTLQRAANRNPRDDRDDWINALFVTGAVSPQALDSAVRQAFSLEDLGLSVSRDGERLIVESRDFVLRPAIAEEVVAVAAADSQPLLSYLANELVIGDRSASYATVAALQTPVAPSFGELTLVGGAAAPALTGNQILLDAWLAEDLAAEAGDALTLSYYAVGPRDELITRQADFEVAGVVQLDGLAVDQRLTPEFPGIAEAGDIASWDPPFPVDLDAVTARDEDYWDLHRAAPKAFVSLATGQRLWSNRFGQLTALRLAAGEGAGGAAAIEARLRDELPARFPLEPAGLVFRSLKQEGLEGSAGATDFTGLFLGFSMFLIASAALLVALLFRLAVENRAPEWGLRLAVGFPLKTVRRQVLTEGLGLALLGVLLGTGLAIAYAAALLRALASWWSPIVDSPFLTLAVNPLTLIAGALASLLLVALVLFGTVRRMGRQRTLALLAGRWGREGASPRRSSRARRGALVGLVLAILMIALGLAQDEPSPALFFGVGAALCGAGFAAFAAWSRDRRRPLTAGHLANLAARNSAANPGRSLLSVILVGCACFVLVSVTANRKATPEEGAEGTGGYGLVAETDVPIRRDPTRFESLEAMGWGPEEAARVAEAGLFPFRLLPGEDASCLNLYKPESPRVLGAPAAFRERGGFHFRSALEEVENPWSLLAKDYGPGVVPAIGDYASVRWILQLAQGDDLVMEDEHGEEVRLRIVAQLEGSFFQSELIVAEERLLEHFPSRGGFSYFVIEDGSPELLAQLEGGFSDYGFDGQATRDKIATYQAVENMYLTTFQALGGLGLLLGTLGLAIVMVRNVLERRGELAALRAFGFRRSRLARLVATENALLLAIGMVIGSVAGLAAVAPHLLAGHGSTPWSSLAGLLAGIFSVGMVAGLVAAFGSLRIPLLETLKRE